MWVPVGPLEECNPAFIVGKVEGVLQTALFLEGQGGKFDLLDNPGTVLTDPAKGIRPGVETQMVWSAFP